MLSEATVQTAIEALESHRRYFLKTQNTYPHRVTDFYFERIDDALTELRQQPAPQAMTEAIFSYDGPAYMRPMFRGLILDQDGIDVDVSSVAPEGDYDVTIVIRPQAQAD